MNKMDLRYGDEEDAEELFTFINEEHKCETDSDNPCFFRGEGPRLPLAEIQSDLRQNRWVVLESPRPSEDIVAALRVRFVSREGDLSLGEGSHRIALIDILCGTTHAAELLFLTEKIAFAHGAGTVVVELPQPRSDLETLVEKCGYENRAGRMWDGAPLELKRPTLVFEFHKKFLTAPAAAKTSTYTFEADSIREAQGSSSLVSPAPSAQPDSDIGCSVFAEYDQENEQAGDGREDRIADGKDTSEWEVMDTSADAEGQMRGLMVDLFAALHREYDETSPDRAGQQPAMPPAPPTDIAHSAGNRAPGTAETPQELPDLGDFQVVGAGGSDSSNGALEGMMVDLFAALHKEMDPK